MFHILPILPIVSILSPKVEDWQQVARFWSEFVSFLCLYLCSSARTTYKLSTVTFNQMTFNFEIKVTAKREVSGISISEEGAHLSYSYIVEVTVVAWR
jgi:hypothetical protein